MAGSLAGWFDVVLFLLVGWSFGVWVADWLELAGRWVGRLAGLMDA